MKLYRERSIKDLLCKLVRSRRSSDECKDRTKIRDRRCVQYVISAELMSLLHTAVRRYLRGLHQAHRKSTWRREMGHGNGCFVDAGASRRPMCALRTVPRLRLRKKQYAKEFRRKAASRLEAPRNISSHFYGVAEPTIPGKKNGNGKKGNWKKGNGKHGNGRLGYGKIGQR